MRTLVILSQVYVPDPASVGQHLHDVAVEMARRGSRVVVLTADRGYDDPRRRYPRREALDGVQVIRLPWSSFGKSGIPVRLLGGGIFVWEAALLAAALPRIDKVLVTTSPPLGPLAGVALSLLRGVPVTFWAMDINPDQIVATGALARDAWPARALEWMNRGILARAQRVVALDRYMAERLQAKLPMPEKLVVLPPWPHLDPAEPLLAHGDNPFRAQHGLLDKFVLMYSGNLSPTHPVTTILEAARRLQDQKRLLFLFIGGGLGREEIDRAVRAHGLRNVRTLPYQPLASLRSSLSAADVHLVAMGDSMVGVAHPCKIYGAMAVGRPILVLGPRASHLSDIVLTNDIGWQIAHGDVEGAVQLVRAISGLPPETLEAKGRRARALVEERYSKRALCSRFCDLLEEG